jgi:hypothetical protein
MEYNNMRELNINEIEQVNGGDATAGLVGVGIGAAGGWAAGRIASVAFGLAWGGPVGMAVGIAIGN